MINKKRLIALTQKVIQFDSQNPPGNEWELSQFIKKDMTSLKGVVVQSYPFRPKRPNIIATLKGIWPRKKATAEAVLVTPHFDTVPVGGGWRFDPFGGKIHQGRIYGRGASDDKGNLACSLEVMRSLVEDRVKFKRDIIMAATADEETGSHYGILPLLQKKILKPRVGLILDSDGFYSIIAQKGLFHCRVKIFGKKAHGAYNWRGINAIEQAAEIIEAIKKHKFTYKTHALLRPPTKNIGTIKGGDKVNIVADYCEFSVDMRYLPSMSAKQVLNDLTKIIRRTTNKFAIEIDDSQNPYEIDPQHPFVQTWVSTCHKMGIKSELKGSEGATVISFFKKAGIPAFATGFATPGTAHITDEHVKIDNLYHGARVLEQFLKDYDQL